MRWMILVGGVIAGIAIHATALASCSKDSDCKGDRVCSDEGKCVAPGESTPTPKKKEKTKPVDEDAAEEKPRERRSEPRRSSAEERKSPTGFEFGLRLGYSLALGNATGDPNSDGSTDKMSDYMKGAVPVWIDGGYRITPNIFVGVDLSYGFGLLGGKASDACTGNVSCSIHNFRIGLNGIYHIMPEESFDPWVGVGFGYEVMGYDLSNSSTGVKANLAISGAEFVNLQVGGDYKVSPSLGVGPFVSLSVAQYSSASITYSGTTATPPDSTINNKSIHELLTFGIRGTFVL